MTGKAIMGYRMRVLPQCELPWSSAVWKSTEWWRLADPHTCGCWPVCSTYQTASWRMDVGKSHVTALADTGEVVIVNLSRVQSFNWRKSVGSSASWGSPADTADDVHTDDTA